MSVRTCYVMLMCSLPHHGPLFGATRPPLSRIRLNQHLALLEEQDRSDYEKVSRLLDWSRHGRAHGDTEILADARALIPTLVNPLARELVQWRLELRSTVAALRHRQRGGAVPGARERWGYGRWFPLIRHHWNEPDFGLGRVFPWLSEAHNLLATGQSVQLERLLLGAVWQDLERRSEGHEFDFEAVLLYALRWEVVARWVRYHSQGAITRFEHLVRETLDDADLDTLAA
jgi:hypothetical protein